MTPQIEADAPPSRLPWPPILIATAIALAALLEHIAPLPVNAWMREAGVAIVILAIFVDFRCAQELWRRRTTVMPHRAVSELVTTGPYRWSRNPIYVSHVVLTASLGLAFGTLWTALLTPALAMALTRLAILPEEAHLARKFGPAYAAYSERTRRWF
jgi:protein-S-isoprenylcysteine O-methyltransferase Ste14